MQRRETGSTVLPARREQVFDLLRRQAPAGVRIRTEGTHRVEIEEAESRSTFVLRDVPGGTRVVHARAARPTLRDVFAPGQELRAAIEADLARLRRLVETDAPDV